MHPYQTKILNSEIEIVTIINPHLLHQLIFLPKFNQTHTDTKWKYRETKILRYSQSSLNGCGDDLKEANERASLELSVVDLLVDLRGEHSLLPVTAVWDSNTEPLGGPRRRRSSGGVNHADVDDLNHRIPVVFLSPFQAAHPRYRPCRQRSRHWRTRRIGEWNWARLSTKP